MNSTFKIHGAGQGPPLGASGPGVDDWLLLARSDGKADETSGSVFGFEAPLLVVSQWRAWMNPDERKPAGIHWSTCIKVQGAMTPSRSGGMKCCIALEELCDLTQKITGSICDVPPHVELLIDSR